jgi:hypothetical protein
VQANVLARGPNSGCALVYATWPAQANGALHQAWASQDASLDSPFRPSHNSYDIFLDAVRQYEPAASIIPAGHASVAIVEASATSGSFADVNGGPVLYRVICTGATRIAM